MVLGEPQILGQVKDAFAAGPGRERRRSAAPRAHVARPSAWPRRCGRRPRWGATPSPSPSPRWSWGARSSASLEGKSVLLVGAGEMAELAARHLVDEGALPIYVANRTREPGAGAGAPSGRAPRSPFDELAARHGGGGHRDRLDRRAEPIIRAADVQGRPARAADAAALPHRHRGAAQRGARRSTTSTTSSATTSTTCARWSRPTSRERQREAQRAEALRRARGRALHRAPARRGGRADHRVAAGQARGDPPRRGGQGARRACSTPTTRRGG